MSKYTFSHLFDCSHLSILRLGQYNRYRGGPRDTAGFDLIDQAFGILFGRVAKGAGQGQTAKTQIRLSYGRHHQRCTGPTITAIPHKSPGNLSNAI